MKKAILIIAMLVANVVIAQNKYETIIKGKIEIDGHVFENKHVKFEANLDGIKIYDSEKEYTHRDCKKPKCEIIHLEEKNTGTLRFNPGWITTTPGNIQLLTN